MRELCDAAERGDLSKVTSLVTQLNVNDKDCESGDTALHRAADKGHLAIVKFLVGKDADINVKNSDDKIPLQLANKHSHQEIVKLLRQESFNAVMQDIRRNNKEKVEKFLENDQDLVNFSDQDGWQLLHYAAKFGNLEVARSLVANNATIDTKINEGSKPLHIAADHGHKNVVKFFINEKKWMLMIQVKMVGLLYTMLLIMVV
jgi:ankyrin repeat protein